jgi:voltage-gated potassium channel
LQLVGLGLLLLGPLALFTISNSTRDIVRIALISVVGLRAINSVRYFFRLRSILYIIGAVILTVVAFGVMMTATEKGHENANVNSLSDGLWWAVSTVSTVGYGDKYPVTTSGRMIATGLMAFGVAMFGILTATLANAFASRSEEDDAGQYARLHERLERIEQGQLQARPVRRMRAPRRPARRTPAPRIGAPPPDEGATTG